MSTPEVISPDEILRDAGAERPVTEGTYLQRTGLRLATGVGALGSVVILALVVKWICWAPALPIIPPETDPATVRQIIDNYKSLQQAALEPLTTLFDIIVVKVLLSILTGILGYIYASSRDGKAKE
jgi:hypothetical protein